MMESLTIDAPAKPSQPEKPGSQIAQDVAVLVLASILAAVFGALTVFILPRITGVEDFGYWRLFLLYSTYVGFLHLGFGEGALLLWAGKPLSEFHHELRPSLKFLVWQHAAILVPSAIVAVFLLAPHARFVAIAVLIYALLQNTVTLLLCGLQAARRFRPVAIAISAPSGFFLIFALLCLFRGKPDYRFLIGCYFLGWLLVLGVLWTRVHPLKTHSPVSAWTVAKRCIWVGWPITLANTAFSLVQTSDRFVLSSAVSIYHFAQYSLAASTMMVPVAIITAAARVFFPHLAATDKEQHPEMYSQAARLIVLSWSVLLPYYFAVEFFVRHFIRAYVPSLPEARVLLLSALFVAAIQILQSSVFNLYGKQKHYLVYCLVSVAISLGLAAAAIYVFHSLLLVAAMQVFAVAVLWLFLARKLTRLTQETWTDLFRTILVFGWSAGSLWCASSWSSNFIVRSFLYWLLTIGPVVLVYGNEMRYIGRIIRDFRLPQPSASITRAALSNEQ